MLVTQDRHNALHFDLKVTYVTRYKTDTLVQIVAEALVEAAYSFEEETRLYITQVSAGLTSDAISVLNIYGRLWKEWEAGSPKPSIFQTTMCLRVRSDECFLSRPLASYSPTGCYGLITDPTSSLALIISVTTRRNLAGVSSTISGSMIL